ncbi:MAG: PTS lactose/cellobiose transporter subunit IIA [Hungatella sp.]|jgi:PTS system cellobiose-specific IIA component|nr:PTS lactose/cellobiose transporter subunit IIA [Hungatella sp.]
MTPEMETSCFGIITYVGTARSCFINAIQCAKKGDFQEADALISQGDEAYTQGHHIHADLLTLDANGKLEHGGLILMHAEDQLMSAETFRVLAEEFIDVYKKMNLQ